MICHYKRGGRDSSKKRFKEWVCEFQTRVAGLEFETVESFQNTEGIRVASRWRVRGRNSGFLGLPPDQRALEMGVATL
jgi:hypothetical protein